MFQITEETLNQLLHALPKGGTVLDVGCAGWLLPDLAAQCGRDDLMHIGADLGPTPPSGIPPSVGYLPIPADGQVFSGPVADLTISRHCLEHSSHPIASFGALLHATRRGGLIYVEAPSELSCHPRSSDDPTDHGFRCFWDDPTHVRPWTPAALYRLTISFGAVPLRCGRVSRGGLPCAALVAQHQRPDVTYRYVSLQNTRPGVAAAMQKIWG